MSIFNFIITALTVPQKMISIAKEGSRRVKWLKKQHFGESVWKPVHYTSSSKLILGPAKLCRAKIFRLHATRYNNTSNKFFETFYNLLYTILRVIVLRFTAAIIDSHVLAQQVLCRERAQMTRPD